VRELEEYLRGTREATICALNQMLDLKDLNTGVHSTRLAEWAVRVGQELGLDEGLLQDIEVAALLHDAGKVGVPDAILHKPGPLDPGEWQVMRMHPQFSWAVLRLVPGLERASLFALHHHEKYDGSGYPAGLRGREIPIGARIVSVIDAFDAMVAIRPYKRGLPCEEALGRLRADSGTHFDGAVVRHFIAIAEAEMSSVFEATGVSASTGL
jgi:HD-GYP domain-containing protein (c-di-GMP phosphodiesterase class II)